MFRPYLFIFLTLDIFVLRERFHQYSRLYH